MSFLHFGVAAAAVVVGAGPAWAGFVEDGPLHARIDVLNPHPDPGDVVEISAQASTHNQDLKLNFTWSLVEEPMGSQSKLTVGNGRAWLTTDLPGKYVVQVDINDGVRSHQRQERIYTRNERRVEASGDLATAVVQAEEGMILILPDLSVKSSAVITRDLTIRSESGSRSGGLDTLDDAPGLTVTGGALVRLEGVNMWVENNGVGIRIVAGHVHLTSSRVVGGTLAMDLSEGLSTLEAHGSQLVGSSLMGSIRDDSQVLLRNVTLGWPREQGFAAFEVAPDATTALALENTILDWREGNGETLVPTTLFACDGGCAKVSAFMSLFPGQGEVWLSYNLGWWGDVGFEEAGFLFEPRQADTLADGDIRLHPSSIAVDASTLPGALDFDGTAVDLGAFGGPYGDWLDVDNDRDGYTNLNGDCDDGDIEVIPDGLTRECIDLSAEGGCRKGGSGGAAGLLVFGLWQVRRRRRAPPG